MTENMIQVQGESLSVNGSRITLRGFGVGSWMNLEHFMVGMPGSDHLIRETFRKALGEERSDGFFRRFLTCFLTEKDFIYLKSLGVNAIRVPFNYHLFLDDQRPGVFREEGFRWLDSAAALCEKYGIYMIPDLHAAPGGQNPDWHSDNGTGVPQFWRYACFREEIVRLWGFFAEHYRDNPWVGGYDLLNEPYFTDSGSQLDDFYRDAIREIRRVDKDHVIFLEGNRFSMDFSALSMPEDPNVAYEIHYYPTVWDPDLFSPGMAEEKRNRLLEESFRELLGGCRRFRRPVWCGEFGFIWEQRQLPLLLKLTEKTLELLEQNGISWTLWAYKDARMMGLVRPRAETPWTAFTAPILGHWNQEKEYAAAQDMIRCLEKSAACGALSRESAYRLQFRLRAELQTVYCEKFLAPALEALPPEGPGQLAGSFEWDSCEKLEEVEALIRARTGANG